MRICIESQLLNHPRRSGVMTYTEGLINGMKRSDKVNDYVLAYYSFKRSAKDMPGPTGEHFTKSVLRIPDRDFWGRQNLIDMFFLPSFFSSEKIDVFHRPAGYTMPTNSSVFKILTVHDLRTLTMSDQFWAQNIKQYERTLSEIDICVVVSECTRQDLIKHFRMNEKKIKVVYLGADERYKRASDKEIEGVKRKFHVNRPFFLSVGSVPRKNIQGIIRGFAKCRYHKDFSLVLNCKYELDKYQLMAEDLGVKDDIVFIKNVSDKDLIALYSACHCFAFPSLYEGFGLPILEAMNCGAPVITSKVSACPEVAGDSALLVDPHKEREISDAMDRMCRDSKMRQSLINKGYERAKMFSWDKFAEEMKSVYSLAYK